MPFELHFPTTFEEAWALLEKDPPGSALPLAGGTDLLLAMEFRRFSPRHVVSLSRLPLQAYEMGPEEVRIGSLVPLRTLELDPRLRARIPALVEAIAEVGSVQLRHRATLGGNVVRSSSSSDLLPPLIALRSHLTLRSREGQRTMPLEEFVQGSWKTGLRPGELVEDVRVPLPRPGTYRWQRVRPANDISQVGLAVVRHPARAGSPRWNLVAGGTTPTVQRLLRAEAALVSEEPSQEEVALAAQRAAEEARFVTDLRAAEEYRRHLLQVLVRRGVEDVLRSPLSKEVGG